MLLQKITLAVLITLSLEQGVSAMLRKSYVSRALPWVTAHTSGLANPTMPAQQAMSMYPKTVENEESTGKYPRWKKFGLFFAGSTFGMLRTQDRFVRKSSNFNAAVQYAILNAKMEEGRMTACIDSIVLLNQPEAIGFVFLCHTQTIKDGKVANEPTPIRWVISDKLLLMIRDNDSSLHPLIRLNIDYALSQGDLTVISTANKK